MNLTYKIRLLKLLILSLTSRRLLNYLVVNISICLSGVFKRPFVWGLPYASSIEPTTRCNLMCPECPTGMGRLHRPKGDLLLDEFKHYLHGISDHTFYLTLYLQGEPFLNKNLPQMIHYATQKRMFTTVSTNGHFLSGPIAEEIIMAGLKKVIISLDGTTQVSYGQYRQNGNFEKVVEGLKYLAAARKKTGSQIPLIVVQFIVFRHNENEIQAIRELGRKIGADIVEIKTAQHYNLKADNLLITSMDKFNRYAKGPDGNWMLKKTKAIGCSRLWTTSVITWNGCIVACCYDKNAEFSFGNLHNKEFKEIWKSFGFMKLRKTVLTNKKTIEICQNCAEK